MIRNSNVRVIGDIESFIDSLLSHTEEENCQHSVSDFLQEYFDKKNGRLTKGLPNGIRNTSAPTTATCNQLDKEGGGLTVID